MCVYELDTPACRAFWHIGHRLRKTPDTQFKALDDFDHLLRNQPTPWFDTNPAWLKWVLEVLEACKKGFRPKT